ncbi:MAG: hypothetical protein J0L76_01335 [Rhodobacterales bacterium]|nr:hypothetical protein [Rhodobacterales bacterium]
MGGSLKYSLVKEKQRAIRAGFPETMGLRVHRAISWMYKTAPHAIAFDDVRWLARASCFTDEVSEDFLLSRIVEICSSRESDILAKNDQDWRTAVAPEIGPHPALSETQAKVIALYYGMKGGKTEIKVRRGWLNYSLRQLGLDTDPDARKSHDQQIVLLNRDTTLGRQGQAKEQ